MTAIQHTTPRTRIRIGHSRTQRDGWQYETTVEVEWDGEDAERDYNELQRLSQLMDSARHLAELERDQRNVVDGRRLSE